MDNSKLVHASRLIEMPELKAEIEAWTAKAKVSGVVVAWVAAVRCRGGMVSFTRRHLIYHRFPCSLPSLIATHHPSPQSHHLTNAKLEDHDLDRVKRSVIVRDLVDSEDGLPPEVVEALIEAERLEALNKNAQVKRLCSEMDFFVPAPPAAAAVLGVVRGGAGAS